MNVSLATIEAALVHELPPLSAMLATIKSDVDTIGAMAVLDIRRWRLAENIGEDVPRDCRARVLMIAAQAKGARGLDARRLGR